MYLSNPGARLAAVKAWLSAAVALRAPVSAVWVGDSHAPYLSGAQLAPVARSAEGNAVVWLGPRLMYSVARDGFPRPLLPQLAGLSWRLRERRLVVALGEIDCRVHLVERVSAGDDLAFVARYVDRVRELRQQLEAPSVVILGPVPPSDLVVGYDNPEFPRRGTLAERIAVTRLLDERLRSAVAAADGHDIVFASLLFLAAPDGRLRDDRTDDGIHVNAAGSAEVRVHLDANLALR